MADATRVAESVRRGCSGVIAYRCSLGIHNFSEGSTMPDQVFERIHDFLTAGIAGSQITLERILIAVVLLAVLVWISGRIVRWLVDLLLRRHGLEVGVTQAIGTLVRYLVVAFGAVIILQSVGINLSALTVVAGALGVGLGFGLQNVVNNFISGLIILFERPIKVGDRVQVGDDLAGNVTRIAARATTVITNDNVAIIVPNSEFISERVMNLSQPRPLIRIHVPVGVSYDADPDAVRSMLLALAAEHDGVLPDPQPSVLFQEFGDNSLNFVLLVWTRSHIGTPNALRSDLNFAIARKFKEAGVEIPFPQRDLHVRSGVLELRRAAPSGVSPATGSGPEA